MRSDVQLVADRAKELWQSSPTFRTLVQHDRELLRALARLEHCDTHPRGAETAVEVLRSKVDSLSDEELCEELKRVVEGDDADWR